MLTSSYYTAIRRIEKTKQNYLIFIIAHQTINQINRLLHFSVTKK